jgi:hypothetical protein
MTAIAHFEDADLDHGLPAPGLYGSVVVGARMRRSSRGHRMVAVAFALDGVEAGRERVADYFVLEGATARGLAVARWRLVALYRACGLEPREGEPIRPGALLGARVGVTIEHEHHDGRSWARVAAYQPLLPCSIDDESRSEP